jgi:hypothetical protein
MDAPSWSDFINLGALGPIIWLLYKMVPVLAKVQEAFVGLRDEVAAHEERSAQLIARHEERQAALMERHEERMGAAMESQRKLSEYMLRYILEGTAQEAGGGAESHSARVPS